MENIITSRQNPTVKSACMLTEKKARYKDRLFRFDGIKLFLDCLGRVDIERVFVRCPISESIERALTLAKENGALKDEKIVYTSESVFEKISTESSPEGIVTVARFIDRLHSSVEGDGIDSLTFEGEKLLIAESLRDTGNLGTIMRSAAALGIDRLIISDDCADIYNPKTVRSAMGALFRLPTLTVKREDLPRLVLALRKSGRHVYAAALCDGAKEIGSIELSVGDCFVIGNEGHGLSKEIIDAADSAAIIPMVEGNESLNAAAAATVCIWETVRAENK